MRRRMLILIFLALLATRLPAHSNGDENGCHPIGASLIENQNIAIFGEYHGTNEIQALFFEIVCYYRAITEDRILVGVELARELTPVFNAEYRDSVEFMSAVLDSEHWKPYGDGRHSPAMERLLRDLYRLKTESPSELLIVGLVEDDWDNTAPDRVNTLISTHGIDKTLILVGNWHTRRTRMPGYDAYPFAYNLLQFDHRVGTYDIWAKGGEFWACTEECGPMAVHPRDVSISEQGLYGLSCQAGESCAYDGFLFTESLSISR